MGRQAQILSRLIVRRLSPFAPDAIVSIASLTAAPPF